MVKFPVAPNTFPMFVVLLVVLTLAPVSTINVPVLPLCIPSPMPDGADSVVPEPLNVVVDDEAEPIVRLPPETETSLPLLTFTVVLNVRLLLLIQLIGVAALSVRLPLLTFPPSVDVSVLPAVLLANVTLLPLTWKLLTDGLISSVTVYVLAMAKFAVSLDVGGFVPTPPVQFGPDQFPLSGSFQLTVAA